MDKELTKGLMLLLTIGFAAPMLEAVTFAQPDQRVLRNKQLDEELWAVLRNENFTGSVESTLEERIGRRIDNQLADTGRLLWFDRIIGLNGDNTCAGCHSPTTGFGDTQSIAIGIENNGIVGPQRRGPRNKIGRASCRERWWDAAVAGSC